VANRIALDEYGVELRQIEDEDIWQYIQQKARKELCKQQKKFEAILLTRGKTSPYRTYTYAETMEEAKEKLLWRYRKNRHVVVSRIQEVGDKE